MTPLNAKYAKCDNPRIVWQQYSDGGKCIQITGDGEDIATASVNIGRLPDGLIAIKDYSENEGVLAWLIENKIVGPPLEHRESGYVKIPICKILQETKRITDEEAEQVINTFKLLAERERLKKGTAKYANYHNTFFTGALVMHEAMGYELRPGWQLCLMTGRDISDKQKPL